MDVRKNKDTGGSGKRRKYADTAVVLLAAAFLLSMLTWLHACGPKEDGSFMHCHTAWHYVTVLAALQLAAAALRCLPAVQHARTLCMVLSILLLLLPVLAFFVPGQIVSLCMMTTMRCQAVMKPGVRVLAVLNMLAAAAGFIAGR